MIKIKIEEVMKSKLPEDIENLTIKFLEKNLEEKARQIIDILIVNVKLAKSKFNTKAVAKIYFTRQIFSPKIVFIENNLKDAMKEAMDERVRYNEKIFTSFVYFHEIGHYIYFLNNIYSYSDELGNPSKVIKWNNSKRDKLVEEYVDMLSFKFLKEEKFFNLVDDITGEKSNYNHFEEKAIIQESFFLHLVIFL